MKLISKLIIVCFCFLQSNLFAQDEVPFTNPDGNWYATDSKEMFMIDWNESGKYIDKIYYAKGGGNFAKYEIMSQTSVDVPDGGMGPYKGYKIKTYLSSNPNLVYHLEFSLTPVSIDMGVSINGNKSKMVNFSNLGKSGISVVNVIKTIKHQIKEAITKGEYDAANSEYVSFGTVKFDFQEGSDEPSVSITYTDGTTEEGMAVINLYTHAVTFTMKKFGAVKCNLANMGLGMGLQMYNSAGTQIGLMMPKM